MEAASALAAGAAHCTLGAAVGSGLVAVLAAGVVATRAGAGEVAAAGAARCALPPTSSAARRDADARAVGATCRAGAGTGVGAFVLVVGAGAAAGADACCSGAPWLMPDEAALVIDGTAGEAALVLDGTTGEAVEAIDGAEAGDGTPAVVKPAGAAAEAAVDEDAAAAASDGPGAAAAAAGRAVVPGEVEAGLAMAREAVTGDACGVLRAGAAPRDSPVGTQTTTADETAAHVNRKSEKSQQ